MIRIAPSILAADFWRLGEEIAAVEALGVDRIHVDVMDGHFVPNLSMGPLVVQAIRPHTKLPLEVHLMVQRPEEFVEPFAKAGADSLLFHWETNPDPGPCLKRIRNAGLKAGYAINPDRPVEHLAPYLKDIDLALCMTVMPGFGGQAMAADSPDRVRRLKSLIDVNNPKCELEVDGGVDQRNADRMVAAGANVLVVGTALFRHPRGMLQAVDELRAAVRGATTP